MSYSIQRVTSDGTLTDVVVGIEFMSQDDIQVYVDEILADGTRDYSYTWVNSNTIRLEPAVALGSEVLVLRSTYIDAMLHDYEAGAVFNPKSMDENFTQLLYNVQEGVERTNITDIYNDVNMHNHNIKNLAVAVDDYDAIPFIQYKEDALGAQEAAERAEDAADRAEAAAGGNAGANLLYEQVATIETTPHNVWWKGNQGVKNSLYMYSTIPGQPDVVINSDGNIIGWNGTWKPTCVWSVPSGVLWPSATHDLYNYLKYGGVNNGFRATSYNGNVATGGTGILLQDYVNNTTPNVVWDGADGTISAALIKGTTGRAGLNFTSSSYTGVPPGYPAFHMRIDTAGQFQVQSNIFAGGDIQAFVPINNERGVLADTVDNTIANVYPNLYPNVTTLEANPNEFGLLDIVEKLAEVIVNLKVKIEALEGAVDALTTR